MPTQEELSEERQWAITGAPDSTDVAPGIVLSVTCPASDSSTMSSTPSNPRYRQVQQIVQVTGWLAIIVGVLVVIGWLADIALLKSVHPGHPAMKFNSAVCFILSGLSLLLLSTESAGQVLAPLIRIAGRLAAGAVCATGLLTTAEWLFRWNFGIDQLLFQELSAAAHPGRMVLVTSIGFSCIGSGLLLLNRYTDKNSGSQLMALGANVAAFWGVLDLVLTPGRSYTGIAAHIAIALWIVSSGLLLARPEQGFMKVLISAGVGGMVARRLLAPAIAIPIFVGWLRWEGAEIGLYRQEVGLDLMVSTMSLMLIAITFWTALKLDALDIERKRAEEALHRTGAYNRSLIEASLDSMVTIAPNGKLTDVNSATSVVTGFSRQELIGTDYSDYFTEPERARSGYQQVFREGWVQDYELQLRHRDGHITPVLYNASVYRDGRGEVAGVFAAARDITERKRAEVALSESKLRLDLAQKAGRLGAYDWTIATNAVIFSPEFEALYGLPPSGLAGSYENWKRAVHWDDIERVESELLQVAKSKTEFETEFRVVWPDQSAHWVAARGSLVFDERGVPLRLVGINVDITERKEVEEALRAERQRFHEVLEMLPAYAILLTPDYHVALANRVFRERFGESKGRRCYEFLFNRTAPCEICETYNVLKNNAPHQWEWTGPDGRTYDVRDFPFQDADGSKLIMEVGLDITDRKKAEEELRKLNSELEQRVSVRTAELTASNKELESFTYAVAHDLRAPLRHIQGFSGLLIEDYASRLDESAQRYLERIRDGVNRMAHLLEDLLNLSRLGRQKLSRQVCGLNSLVETVRNELQADTKGRQIDWRIGPLPFVECDPALMKQVFANLLANAVKFTRPREKAVIEVGQVSVDGGAAIFVRDNGVGFSMKYADKLFGIFQRLHRQEDFEGTGVGLATVQRIVHKHDGRVWAEAELDRGATFYFTIGTSESDAEK